MDVLGISDHGDVCNVCSTVRAKWKDLGARLGVLEPTLAEIEHNHRFDAGSCLSAVISTWLRRPRDAVRDNVVPTWKSLCEALWYIDGTLARDIAYKHNCYSVVFEATSLSAVPPAFLSKSCGCGQCTIEGWRTGRVCQRAVEDSRPKLLVVNPHYRCPEVSELVKFETSYDRQARLCCETSKVAAVFLSVSEETWRILKQAVKEQKFSVSDITFKLGCRLQLALPTLSTVHELQRHFHSLLVSWFNFKPLYLLCEMFLSTHSSLVEAWSSYLQLFKNYCSSRNLKTFVNVFFQVAEQNVFLLEVDECLYQFTLSDIRALRRSLCIALSVPSVCLHLVTVSKGSLIIYFHYCSSDYLVKLGSLTKKQLKDIAEIKAGRILSLVDLHHQFKYNNIQSYCDIEDEELGKNKETELVEEKKQFTQGACSRDDETQMVAVPWGRVIALSTAREDETQRIAVPWARGIALSKAREDETQRIAVPWARGIALSKAREDETQRIAVPCACARGIAFTDNGDMFVTSYGTRHCVYVYRQENGRMEQKQIIGSEGDGELEFSEPHGIAIDGETVYVAEYSGNRIHMFTTGGEFLRTFGSQGSETGQLNGPHDVKISPEGKVYVADRNNDRIQVFNKDGTVVDPGIIEDRSVFLHPEGLAFDHSGSVHVTGYGTKSISVFDSEGKHVREYDKVSNRFPKGIVIDSSGFSFVTSVEPRGGVDEKGFLLVYDKNGSFVCSIDGFVNPFGVSVSSDGSIIWVVDRDTNIKYKIPNNDHAS